MRLLSALQEDARQTAGELAEKVKLSSSSVQKRLVRLRANGVISREIAVLNLDKIGGFMFIMVQLQMVGGRPRALETTRQFARRDPRVLQCFHVTGGADLILLVTTRTMAEFETFSNRHFFGK